MYTWVDIYVCACVCMCVQDILYIYITFSNLVIYKAFYSEITESHMN